MKKSLLSTRTLRKSLLERYKKKADKNARRWQKTHDNSRAVLRPAKVNNRYNQRQSEMQSVPSSQDTEELESISAVLRDKILDKSYQFSREGDQLTTKHRNQESPSTPVNIKVNLNELEIPPRPISASGKHQCYQHAIPTLEMDTSHNIKGTSGSSLNQSKASNIYMKDRLSFNSMNSEKKAKSRQHTPSKMIPFEIIKSEKNLTSKRINKKAVKQLSRPQLSHKTRIVNFTLSENEEKHEKVEKRQPLTSRLVKDKEYSD